MWPQSLDELCRFGPLVHHFQLHIAAVAAAQAQLWGTPGMCTHKKAFILTMYPCTLVFKSLRLQNNFCIELNINSYYEMMTLNEL